MYPNCYKYFLDKFERATNKKHWKLMIDLHPNNRGKDCFMEDGQCEQEASSFNRSSEDLTLTQLYFQQVKQQRNALEDNHPYRVQAVDT